MTETTKKWSDRVKHFYNDVYGENIYFCADFSKEEFIDFVNHQSEMIVLIKNGESFKGRCVTTHTGTFIWVRGTGVENIGILSHEIFHACHNIFADRGIKIEYASDEPFAYMIQWMTEKLIKHMDIVNDLVSINFLEPKPDLSKLGEMINNLRLQPQNSKSKLVSFQCNNCFARISNLPCKFCGF